LTPPDPPDRIRYITPTRNPGMPILVHTADVHLGRTFLPLGQAGAVQRLRLREALSGVCRLARDRGAEGLLIAGDLFESPRPAQRDEAFVAGELRGLAEEGIFCAILPGTHDRAAPGSVYLSGRLESAHPLIHVFGSREPWRPPGSDIVIHCNPQTERRRCESPLAGLAPDPSARFNIALGHGSLLREGKVDPDDSVFTAEEIDRCGMDYVALGHWHNTLRCPTDEVEAWYPGSPEMIATDETDSGNALVVELSKTGAKIEKVRVGRTKAERIEVDVSACLDGADLEKRISDGADADTVRNVRLTGLATEGLFIDAEALEEACGGGFLHLRVEDRSHAASDARDDPAGSRTVLGHFERLMREVIERGGTEEETAVAERAMQYGSALLRGRDVL